MKNWSIFEYIFTIAKRKSFSAPKNLTNIFIYSNTFYNITKSDGNFNNSSNICGCYGDNPSSLNILVENSLYSIYNISSFFLCIK